MPPRRLVSRTGHSQDPVNTTRRRSLSSAVSSDIGLLARTTYRAAQELYLLPPPPITQQGECGHKCHNKTECLHSCCKRHLRPQSQTETEPDISHNQSERIDNNPGHAENSQQSPNEELPDIAPAQHGETVGHNESTQPQGNTEVDSDNAQSCNHRCANRFTCKHACCKRNLNLPESKSALLAAASGLRGSRMNLKLTHAVWELADKLSNELFQRYKEQNICSATAAEDNIATLTACIVVSCAVAATREHGDRGVTIRSTAPPQRLHRRPTSNENACKHLRTETKLLRGKERHAPRDTRVQLHRQARNAEVLVSKFANEAELLEIRREQKEATLRFSKNAWAAATETLERPTDTSSTHPYPTCETFEVVEHFSKILQPPLSTANLPDESQLTSQK